MVECLIGSVKVLDSVPETRKEEGWVHDSVLRVTNTTENKAEPLSKVEKTETLSLRFLFCFCFKEKQNKPLRSLFICYFPLGS